MDSRLLGRTGVEVSRVILGGGNFGGIGSAPELFGRAGETEPEAMALMDAAWDMGITCLDTAASYGGGRSETAIGAWLGARRHPATVVTKVFFSVTGDQRDQGLAPHRIRNEIAGSLRRLGLGRVPLYMIHEPDPHTPIADTLVALDELVRAGCIGAIGACNVDGAFLEEALRVSAERGLVRFEWVQNSYSLLDRTAEKDVLVVCQREGLGFTPFSPLAGGWLTGKYRRGAPHPPGSRMTLRPGPYRAFEDERVFRALEALDRAAHERGVSPAALALAWVLAHPAVTAAVAGPRRAEHLAPIREAVSIELAPEERDRLAALFAFQ